MLVYTLIKHSNVYIYFTCNVIVIPSYPEVYTNLLINVLVVY